MTLYFTNYFYMDYNTSRKKLAMPEYGRNIQNMVDFAVTIESREERNRVARTIIQILGNLNPHLRDIGDFKYKLWDHLAIMSDFKLDVDYPKEPITLDELRVKPERLPYPKSRIQLRHYGKTIENLIVKACEMEQGQEQDALIELVANHMKKLYLAWNREAVTDEIIFSDIKLLSKGKITVDPKLRLTDSKEILSRNAPAPQHKRPKKQSKRR